MSKYTSFGAKFQRDVTATWTDIAQIQSFGDFSITKDTIECTAHDSAGQFREYIESLKDVEEFDLSLYFDPDDTHHTYLRDQAVQGTLPGGETFRTVLTGDTGVTADTWEFDAIVTGFQLTGREIEGLLEAVVTFKPTGAPDFAPA